MSDLRSRFLALLKIQVSASHDVGAMTSGRRRIDVFEGGSFVGPRINATIVNGADALRLLDDGIAQPNVRFTMQTDDGAIIYAEYRGIRHASAEVMARIAAEVSMPEHHEYYLRNAIFFETGSEKYSWLNRLIGVGVGRRLPRAAEYDVYEIL